MKIAIYAICKNEKHNVNSWLENVRDADSITVLDTGSTDNTFQEFQGTSVCYVNLHKAELQSFRFDVARNFALSQVPDDSDYCLFLDLDERLSEGWYETLKAELIESRPDEVHMDLIYTTDSEGNTKSTYYQTKCHLRESYIWRYPCHEVLIKADGTETLAIASEVNVTHNPSDRERDYLDLLELGAKERPDDQRALYYFGRQLYVNGQHTRAIETLNNAINAPYMQWSKQKAACYKYIAYSIQNLTGSKDAEYYFLQYLSLSLDEAEAFYELADFYYGNTEYDLAKGFINRLLKLVENSNKTDNFIYRDIECWTWKPYDMLAYICYYLGDYPGYLQNAVKAVELCPTRDERLDNNVLDAYHHNIPKEEATDG